MLTETIIEDPSWQAVALDEIAERAATAVLRHLSFDPGDFEIAVLACDDARIAELNAEFRGKPAPTNVLSWPTEELAPEAPGSAPPAPSRGRLDAAPAELGDIAIAYGVCEREARAMTIPLEQHATHLVVHGTLHLLGYDHENDADAALMESIETAILCNMGLPDPYAD